MIQDLKKKERTIERLQRYVNCPLCNNEIIATSDSQLKYNIEAHLLKHEREAKE